MPNDHHKDKDVPGLAKKSCRNFQIVCFNTYWGAILSSTTGYATSTWATDCTWWTTFTWSATLTLQNHEENEIKLLSTITGFYPTTTATAVSETVPAEKFLTKLDHMTWVQQGQICKY